MCLNPELVRLFQHNGFLKLPQGLPPAIVDELARTVLAQIRDEVAPVVRDRQGRVVRISDLWGRGGVFQDIITHASILDPLEWLLGPNIEFVLNRHNHVSLRLADDGSSYMHRDVLQWSRPIATVIVYLEATTLENGCTWAVPGSHQFPWSSQLDLKKEGWVNESGLLDQALPIPMPAGGLMVMNSLVMHGAGVNRTPGSRMSLTLGYHSVDELSRAVDPRRVLVRGERLYLGNDR